MSRDTSSGVPGLDTALARTRRWVLILMGVVVVLVVLVVLDRITIARLTGEIRSCVQPEGECAQRGQARTAEAVRAISLSTVFAAECATSVPSHEIRACVDAKLAAEQARLP